MTTDTHADHCPIIPLSTPYLTGNEAAYVSRAISSRNLEGDGPFGHLCQAWLERTLGCEKAFLTHSGTGALEMAALLCEIKPGDEVVMPSFTFPSTANAFILRGAVPVFIDIRPDTLNLDASLIPELITPRTRAIVAVHYSGIPCDMDAIMEIAASRSLWVIEDAAHAFMATDRGRSLGTIGHLGCLSFHETKNIISGEGGSLLINESHLIDRAEILREKGTNRSRFLRREIPKYRWMDIGSSFLPNELTAAFLWAQMEAATTIGEQRRAIFNTYVDAFSNLQSLGVLHYAPLHYDVTTRGHIFYLILDTAETRVRLADFLKRRGIASAFHYVPLHSSPGGERFGKTPFPLPYTEALSARLLRLPLFCDLTESDLSRIIGAVKEFFA